MSNKSRNPGVFSNLKRDIPSSIVVFLVALPLCLGIALASGAPPLAGVIAGIVGGIVVGMVSGSSIGVSGPAAGLAAIVVGYLGEYEYSYFLLAVILAGIMQLALGYAKAGVIGDYVPSSVIKGMLAAIGIILILKQIPHGFGYDEDYEGDMDFVQPDNHNTFSELYYMLDAIELGAVIITVVSLGILLLWQTKTIKRNKLLNLIPAPLLVVLFGVLMNELYKVVAPELALMPSHLVNVPVMTSVDELVGSLTYPDFGALGSITFDGLKQLFVMGFTMAIVASLETLLSVEATDKMDPLRRITPTNLELKAQGLGNLFSGLIGGLPVTQVIVRSTANVNAGGRTKLAAIVHGFLLLGSLLAIPYLLNLIPLASLAAILIIIGYKLASLGLFKDMYYQHTRQFIPFILTVAVILVTNLLVGIVTGLIIAVFYILRDNRQNEPFEVWVTRNTENGKDYHVFIKLYEEVTYLSKNIIMVSLHDIPDNSFVLIDGSESRAISPDVEEVILEFKNNIAPERNIEVDFKRKDARVHKVDDNLLKEMSKSF